MGIIIDRLDFQKETVIIQWKNEKKKLLLATKAIEKITDGSNVEEYYNSYLKRNDAKLAKRSKIITQQPKTVENLQKSWHKIRYRTSKNLS